MKYCNKCGAELLDEAVMCTKCGEMLEKKMSETQRAEITKNKNLGLILILASVALIVITVIAAMSQY